VTAPAFDPWAALRAIQRTATVPKAPNPPNPAPPPAGRLGALGGLGGEEVPGRATAPSTAALTVPGAAADREPSGVAAAQAQERSGAHVRAMPAPRAPPCSEAAAAPAPLAARAEHRGVLAGVMVAGLQRPPAWSDPAAVPPAGAWCGCCGRFSRSGGRWWREAAEPKGWRCWTCHPPAPLSPADVVERRT
jgi:hypothetical protein